jgi:hypothetical protein
MEGKTRQDKGKEKQGETRENKARQFILQSHVTEDTA